MKPSEKYEKSPFRVPDNYFSELNDRIIESTIGRKKTGLTAKLSVLKPLLSLAAVIAGAAVITLAVLQLVTGDGKKQPGLSHEVVADIPQFLIDGIDMFMIEAEAEGYEPAIPLSLHQHGDEIIEYLLLNEIELSLLIEYLGDEQIL